VASTGIPLDYPASIDLLFTRPETFASRTMDREKHTSHGEDPMPRLEILANPKGGTSHATKLLHVEFDV
jgi:hypothetical protein